MEKVKGLSKKTKQSKTHRYQYGDYQRKKGVGEVEEGERGINGDGQKLDLGW